MPERVITSCTQQFNEAGELKPLSAHEARENILNHVVVNEFAKSSLRSIAFAYKDFSHE